MRNTGGAGKVLRPRQRTLDEDRPRQIHQPDRNEGFAPRKIVGDHTGDVPPQKSAQHCSRNVRRHDPETYADMALPTCRRGNSSLMYAMMTTITPGANPPCMNRQKTSEEHTSELQSLRHLVC